MKCVAVQFFVKRCHLLHCFVSLTKVLLFRSLWSSDAGGVGSSSQGSQCVLHDTATMGKECEQEEQGEEEIQRNKKVRVKGEMR